MRSIVLIALPLLILGYVSLYKAVPPSEVESAVCGDCAYMPSEQIHSFVRAYLTGILEVDDLAEVVSQLSAGRLNHFILHCIEMQIAVDNDLTSCSVDQSGITSDGDTSFEFATNLVNQCAEQNQDTRLQTIEYLLS